jgi:hypothetical protein
MKVQTQPGFPNVPLLVFGVGRGVRSLCFPTGRNESLKANRKMKMNKTKQKKPLNIENGHKSYVDPTYLLASLGRGL